MYSSVFIFFFFFFNDTATTEIYTLSLHDALPIYLDQVIGNEDDGIAAQHLGQMVTHGKAPYQHQLQHRSEEHTSELQSHSDLVCRLLLEKKKKQHINTVCCIQYYASGVAFHTTAI